jgi:hypothetical protein
MKRFRLVLEQADQTSTISMADCLMSGLALFSLKYPSLLKFDNDRTDDIIQHNLRSLYGIRNIPCDTYLRERLDQVSPHLLRKTFTTLFAQVQRGNELTPFQFMDDYYLLSVDGTGYFSSHQVHCEHCCVKHHRDGSKTYYHQMLGAALVHPNHSHVLPFAPEPILKQDGNKKNDCEREASKRLLTDLRREHSHLKLIVIEDGLASNGPHIQLLTSLDMRFILGAKPKDHTFLFDWVENSTVQGHELIDDKGHHHRFKFINRVPLNDSHFDCEVNFLEYWETTPKGKVIHFTWVTDLELTPSTVYTIMKGARARWRIENETFNTLKNQGYHFEHNFGHGEKHLATVMAYLMLLAFLIDQIQGLCCQLFKEAVVKAKSKSRFWEKLRAKFTDFLIDTWEAMYLSYLHPPKIRLTPDTS